MPFKVRLLTISTAAGLVAALAASAVGANAAQAGPSVWDAVYTSEQAERGGAFYGKECAACHGEGLMGQDQSPALVGPGFLANWNGQTVAALFEQTRKSMPKNNPNAFSRQEYLDVVAFMLKANGFPVGKTELPRSTAELTELRITQIKSGVKSPRQPLPLVESVGDQFARISSTANRHDQILPAAEHVAHR